MTGRVPLTEREASVIVETVVRMGAMVQALMQVAATAANLSDDDAVRELLRAGVDTTGAQIEAAKDVLAAVLAEREERRA